MSDNKLIKSFVSAWRVKVYLIVGGDYGVYIEHEDFSGHKTDKFVSQYATEEEAIKDAENFADILRLVLEITSGKEERQ